MILPIMALGVQIVLMALLPLGALITLWRTQAKQTIDEISAAASAHTPHSTYQTTAHRKPRAAGDLTIRRLIPLAVTMLIFSAVSQFMWCYFIKMLPGRLDTDLFLGIFVVVIAVTALAACIAIVIMERQHSYRLELFYRAMMLFCLLGVAATGVAAANELTVGLFITYALVYIGYSLAGPTMWLLALGFTYLRRDVGYICRVLYIARNTANVHRKNIYTKLGIHSQQELLSLVEQADPYER